MKLLNLNDDQYVIHQDTEELVTKVLDSAQGDLAYAQISLGELTGGILAADRERITTVLDSIDNHVRSLRAALATMQDVQL